MKRIEATLQAGRKAHEPFASQPELKLDGLPIPLTGDGGARAEPDRQVHYRPLFTEHERAGHVRTGKQPLPDRVLPGVAPGTEFLQAADVKFQAAVVSARHQAPLARYREGHVLVSCAQDITTRRLHFTLYFAQNRPTLSVTFCA